MGSLVQFIINLEYTIKKMQYFLLADNNGQDN